MKFSCRYFLVSLTFVLLIAVNILAQDNFTIGLESFKKGNYKEAVDSFKSASKVDKQNSEIWNYLGLAYIKTDKTKKARKSFEKAIKYGSNNSAYYSNLAYVYLIDRKMSKTQDLTHKAIELNPKNTNAYYFRGLSYLWKNQFEKALVDAEKAIAIDPTFLRSYLLKADSLLYRVGSEWGKNVEQKSDRGEFLNSNVPLLTQSLTVLQDCIARCKNGATNLDLKNRVDSIRAFLDYFERTSRSDKSKVKNANRADYEEIKVLSKPAPSYSNRARFRNVAGKILIALLFSADGEIKNVMILKGLGYGLDENVVTAARRIKFVPAKKNGKPVSVVKLVQYSFSIY